MITILLLWLPYLVYTTGKVIAAALLGIHDDHVLIGSGSKVLFTIRMKKLTLSVTALGLLPGQIRFWALQGDQRTPARYGFEFTDVALWKRFLFTFSGGITMLVLSILLSVGYKLTHREVWELRDDTQSNVLRPTELGERLGLQEGDIIYQLDGKEVVTYRDFYEIRDEASSDSLTIGVRRLGMPLSYVIPKNEDVIIPITYPLVRDTLSVNEAIGQGIGMPFDVALANLKSLAKVFIPRGRDEMDNDFKVQESDPNSGLPFVFKLIVYLSVLFMLDFFPFGPTAGLRALALISEGLFRRRLARAYIKRIQKMSFYLIIASMVYLVLVNLVMTLL